MKLDNLTEVPDFMHPVIENNGYHMPRIINGEVCALFDYYTTRAIVLGLDETGNRLRYCYQDRTEAVIQYALWDGTGHPGGNWIKVKGRIGNQYVDDFNPNWSKSE
jgi:hypothetical protein